MKTLHFSITIKAAREQVWHTMWHDETFRKWAGVIDPGTHMVGDLVEGNEIQFISGNGYGVTSFVEKRVPNECVVLRHKADTQRNGRESRNDQWTGGSESYMLAEQEGVTTLSATFEVPPELETYFTDTYPKALQTIQRLAEQ